MKKNEHSADLMMSYLHQIYPLPRKVNSPGLDESFKIIKAGYPDLHIYEYPSGMVCEDWVVPYSWEVITGALTDEQGNILVSLDDNILFVASYSEPVNGWFSKEEIFEHALIHPKQKDVFMFQHRLGFNLDKPDWGVSLPQNIFDQLDNDQKYHIEIKVRKKENSMKVAEWKIDGASKETICFAAHIDEPLCNDDLTGCVVGLELMQYIQNLPDRKYSYQLLIFPETFGSLVHMYNHKDDFTHTLCQLNLEMVGAGEQVKIKHSFAGDTRFDNALELALKENNIDYGELDFFDGYGNDERSFEWPTFGIPGIGLQRHPFKYYHTSKDTPECINPEYLIEALQISQSFVNIFEKDYIPAYTRVIAPKLSKHGLYFDSIHDKEKFKKFNNDLLYMIDGKMKISEIAYKLGLNFSELYNYLEKFYKLELIQKK